MKLDRLILSNFRQFYGRQTLTFSRSDTQNVTVVHGVNGAGKTSLFTAINWCLYGAGAEHIGNLINKEAVAQAQVGATVQAGVELWFTHEGERFVAARKIYADKRPDGSARGESNADFSLQRISAEGQAKKVDNPNMLLNTILSPKVRTYFFFDGEKIDNFAKPEASDEVREAVYNVLGLEILTRGADHLRDVAASLRSEWRKQATGRLGSLLEQEIEKRAQLDRLKQRQQDIAQEITSARRHLDGVEQRLRVLEASRHLQEKLDMLNAQLRDVSDRRAQLITSIRDISSQGYVALSGGLTANALAILNEKRERGEIPSNIRQQFVQDLLQQLVCVCGRPFAPGDDAYRHLQTLLANAVSGTLEDDVVNTSAHLGMLFERVSEVPTSLAAAMGQKVQLSSQYDSLYAQIADINQQFKSSDQDEIQGLGRSREHYLTDIESYQVEKGENTTRIDMLNKELLALQDAIAQARKAEATAELMGRKVELAQRAADAMDEIYQAFAEDRRQRIEAEAQQIFQTLVWKDTHFRGMSLDKDYRLEVYDHWGQPARPELSAGERQVLSLAFIMAMAQVSGEEAPLVMDTPFGRLSSAHRENITSNIPQLAAQLILFVTDEELRGQALENLKSRIGAEYHLVFDHRISCTTIEEVR